MKTLEQGFFSSPAPVRHPEREGEFKSGPTASTPPLHFGFAREHEVSPSQRSLSPLAELAAYSKNRTAADFWMNEYKTVFPKTVDSLLDCLTYEHECSSSVKGWNMHTVHVCAPWNIYLRKNIIKDFDNSVEVTAGYIEVLFQKHEICYWAFSCIKIQYCWVTLMKNNHGFIIMCSKHFFFLLHIDYNLYNQFYYKYNG